MKSKILTLVKDALVPTKCVVCGNIIVGAYYMDVLGNKVCMHHKDKAVHCLSCGRLCSKEKATYIGHSQFICETCASNSPQDKDIPPITEYVRKHLSDVGLDGIPDFILHRVELDELHKISGSASEGCATYDGVHSDIYVLKYLSKTCYAGVLAHEMLHLWQYRNGLSPRQDICEGFCNLGSYEIYKAIGTDVALSRISGLEQDPDPIYGNGFRRVKSVYDTGGWSMVIDKIKSTKK